MNALFGTWTAFRRKGWILLPVLLSGACATWYHKQGKMQGHLERGNLEKAYELATAADKKEDKLDRSRNRALYYLNRGTLAFATARYSECLDWLNKADIYDEDLRKNRVNQALSLVVNPKMEDYALEDHEKILIHYYKALSYQNLGNLENALVESRRMNLKLQALSDKYSKKNRYSSDAWGWALQGLLYEMRGEENNAFITYRNSLQAYEEIYTPQFGVEAPEWLIPAMVRTARASGLRDQAELYTSRLRGMGQAAQTLAHDPETGKGRVLVIWENGLGPVKVERSLDFQIIRSPQQNTLIFMNALYGWSFAFPYDPKKEQAQGGIGQLELVRIALPDYAERAPFFIRAEVEAPGLYARPLQVTQNVTAIAVKSLQDRIYRELGESLLRFALKKAAEYRIRQENQDLGALAGIVNAITEQADTRNWQTLPHALYTTMLDLPAGEQELKVVLRPDPRSRMKERVLNQKVLVQPGQMHIVRVFSPECMP